MMQEDIDSVREILIEEMKDVYDAEHQIMDSITAVVKAANSRELKGMLRHHKNESEYQIRRLEQAFSMLDVSPDRKKCQAMQGLIKEVKEMVGRQGNDLIKDLGLISSVRRIEHYEMAGYENMIVLAYAIGKEEIAHLLEETLAEEITADDMLSTHSEQLVGLRLLHLQPSREALEA